MGNKRKISSGGTLPAEAEIKGIIFLPQPFCKMLV